MFAGVRRWWWAVGAAIAVAGVVVWVVWPSAEVEPRPREYADVSACLLTDGQGVAGAEAGPVWAGMQDASLKTHGQARHLTVSGEQSVVNAKSFVGTLILGRCAVIVAVGQVPVQAVLSLADQHPGQRFLVVGDDKANSSNVSSVPNLTGDAVRNAVTTAVVPVLENRS
jgi:hypothetical protein